MTKKHDRQHQIALIVEGGGFKSGFTAGVLDSFIINGFNPFHLNLGVSGGAMNLTSYISRQYKRNINIISAMSKKTNFISIVRFLKGGNYMELKYLLEVTSKQYPFDIDAASKHLKDADCRVVVTNYLNGNSAYLSVKKYGWLKTMEATGSLPMATRGYCKIAGRKYIDGSLSDPLPVKRVYDWGYRNIVLLRTHTNDMKADWNLETLYAPLFYRDNPKLQKLIMRNDKIYSREQKYISNSPKDLKLIQVAPETELECGVISNNLKDIQMDYRYGLELGLDALPKLQTLSADLAY
jgi:predicted patatin/cPLA2 family phospholipase